MTVRIKICGLRDSASVRVAVEAGADFVGFVYFPASPRHLPLAEAAQLKTLLPAHVASVSVLVDADDALIGDVGRVLAPSYVQLHGQETPERVAAIRTLLPAGTRIIKALRVRDGDDVAKGASYGAVADMLLFDARAPEGMLPGGNGLSFDWALLRGREFPLPWALSGGLHVENVAEAVAQTGAKIVDVSSGIESAPGVKDTALIKAFVKAVRA